MLAHHAMPSFRCRTTCNHKECQRHAPLGIIDQNTQCECLGEVNASSIFLENVLDMANTLAQIMIVCGIHECKAKSTVDVSTYAFLHYDQVCYCLDTVPKKRIRKEDLFHELGRKCLMNRVEAHLAYTIIKRGFKAFYYKPTEHNSYQKSAPNQRSLTDFSEECVYVHAARKTAESYARYDGLSCDEQRGVETKIKVAYRKFYDRMQTRMTKPAGDDCNCCFCAKKRGHYVYGKEPPCSPKKRETAVHKCPHCCRKKRSMVHPAKARDKCPVCHRSRKFCTCEKYQFSLNWVESIWARPDFNRYYKEEIEEYAGPVDMANHCRPISAEEAEARLAEVKSPRSSKESAAQRDSKDNLKTSPKGSPRGSAHNSGSPTNGSRGGSVIEPKPAE